METRAEIQHRIVVINGEFTAIMRAMEFLFDKIYELNELPAGSWKEAEEKRLGRSLFVPEIDSTIEEIVLGDKIVVREKLPASPAVPVAAPKKPRQKKKQVVVASPTGPVADEILNM